eukprot:CAMPEP_0168624394 /NCGR_PEP_ID=MMETSP0449_2-20121227/9378_1 /TAXON_ID=1082188 /ORGANISM="Strombidium rassoulzadegani, Strain ras09" /LENGTH=81 /DNA_ID=CAMNT_0008665925 /DNA_START=196 /DNA_END=438 /DNA_ORIENTATION=+
MAYAMYFQILTITVVLLVAVLLGYLLWDKMSDYRVQREVNDLQREGYENCEHNRDNNNSKNGSEMEEEGACFEVSEDECEE